MNERFLPAAPGGAVPANIEARELAPYDAQDRTPEEASGFQLASFLRMLYRWRWLVLGITLITALGVIAFTALQTPLYRATATMELNPDTSKVVQDEGSEEARQSDRDFLALQIGLIKSRAVAERVARKLNLGQNEAFLGHAPIGSGRPETAVGTLMENFSANGTTSDRIMQISYVHPDPQIAARVVNAYADQAIENTYERANEATARSRTYLQKRLEVTRQELEVAEKQLIDYARAANIVNVVTSEGPRSGDSAGGTLVAGNLVALNEQLADAQNARIVAQQRYQQAGASAQAATAADSTVQSLQQQRAQLQAEYDQKLTRYKPDFPEMAELRNRISGLERQISAASGRTSSAVSGSLRADFIAAQNRENQLRAKIKQLESQLLDLNDRGVQYTILQRAVDAKRSMYNALLERLGQENSSATRSSPVSLVDEATAPGAPFSPNLPRAIVLGLMGGLVLGSAGAFAADRWYDTINLAEDLRDLLGVPVLGIIPKVGTDERIDDLLMNPRSSLAEAYHSTRASLQYTAATGAPKSVLFTSSRAAEGKTSTTIAIAADFISVGKRVIVVDCDLRKPSLRGDDDKGGLSSYLTGTLMLHEVTTRTETRGLDLITAGPIPPNPTSLLDSPMFVRLIRELERAYDVVIIDGPPVLGLADAPIIGRVVEATVMIVESGTTRRSAVIDAARRLHQTGSQLIGTVLTKFDRKAQGYGYGYGYGAYSYYEYGEDAEVRTRRLVAPPSIHHDEAA